MPCRFCLVALYKNRAALCGPSGDQPPVYYDLDHAQAEAICRAALQEPNRHAALRLLHSVLPEIKETTIPGLQNAGLFATHELLHGVPARQDWDEALHKSQELKEKRGRALLESLGFQINDTTQQYSVLRTAQSKIAVAVFLDRSEATDAASERFGGMTPVQYALAKADEENLDYVIIDHGASLRIYCAGTGKGVGRRGRTETFIEAHLDLLPDNRAAYLWLLFSGDALSKEGAFNEILESSNDYAAGLGGRLRERIYDEVVPRLAIAIARARKLDALGPEELAFTYEMALAVLFRLLFIAYAEDKDLLPYQSNVLYKGRSLKQKARELAELRSSGSASFDESTSLWDEVFSLFRVVDTGTPREWGVPAYNGGLFSGREDVSPAGAALAALTLPNSDFGEALTYLLVDQTLEGIGPVDFRSLGVREFGTIYEGLLGSELSVAETPLAIDTDGFYVPAAPEEDAEVAAGEYYLHDTNGKRKSTGSYYTKTFAVDHLLDHALEPALKEHLERLDAMDDRAAADAFFDFRVADIAMGSGHFLVAAVDRIERGLGSYLVKRPLPDVVTELRRLRTTAIKEMEAASGSADGLDIDNDQLLRRHIARRCIYGVDINPVAVQLARLSLWIHTFVPGLPLSFLDHNIVCGNSLVGIATMDEVADILGGGEESLFGELAEQYLAPARENMERLAKLSDADASQIEEAREVCAEARESISETEALFDVLTAARLPEMNYTPSVTDLSDTEIEKLREKALSLLKDMPPFHFPIDFPEVFLRERTGFDVIIGNPPWQEATVEEDAFWARHFPGFRSLPQREQEAAKADLRIDRPDLVIAYERELAESEAQRHVLTTGPYPGMGTGDPDLYKAFCWRFWLLVAKGGAIGVVLPRSVFTTSGSAPWRIEVLPASDSLIVICRNRGEWIFDDVNPGYTVCLTTFEGAGVVRDASVRVAGIYESRDAFLTSTHGTHGVPIRVAEQLASDPLLCIPSVESETELDLFKTLLRLPRFGASDRPDWRARAVRDLDATNARKAGILREGGDSPVYNHLNVSHFRFLPTEGEFLRADFEEACAYLHNVRMRSSRRSDTAFAEMSPAWNRDPASLPARHPRVAFRDVVHASNPRKVWAALVPSGTLLTNTAPYLLFPRGGIEAQAFVLGMLNSSVCDWFGHLRIGLHLNFFILDALPVPLLDRKSLVSQKVIELATALATPDGDASDFQGWDSLPGFGSQVDYDLAVSELDGIASLLYGLSDDQLAIVWNSDARLRPPREAVVEYRRFWRRRL